MNTDETKTVHMDNFQIEALDHVSIQDMSFSLYAYLESLHYILAGNSNGDVDNVCTLLSPAVAMSQVICNSLPSGLTYSCPRNKPEKTTN